MKYLLIALVAIAIAVGFMVKHSNEKREELAAQAAEIQQRKDIAKQAEVNQQQAKASKAQMDKEISAMQTKMTIDYAEAKKIIESEKMSQSEIGFYTEFNSKWLDALQLAGSTGRIALAGPVKDMQVLKREFSAHQPRTYCETKMYEQLSDSYDYAIDGFIDFMRDSSAGTSINAKLSANAQQNANVLFDYC